MEKSMSGAEESEGFSDWEQIHSPTHSPPIRIEDNDLQHKPELSVFPPNLHEGLEIKQEQEEKKQDEDGDEEEQEEKKLDEDEEVKSSVEDAWSCTGEEANSGPLKKANEVGKVLTSGIVKFAARVRYYVSMGSAVWSVGTVKGVVAAVLLSFLCAEIGRWRTRRVREDKKDQKINQLLVQIAHMNELLSARRRVPVIRVS